jgi:anion-transporting  ArsA/GET3 family ATPase
MAMEKLHELVESGDFDVVVVDTPPTRNALDLLDAPRRLTRFLENRLFRALLLPTRVSLRAVGLATQALLRTLSKVAGAEIVQDAVAFFQAFEGMEEGFRTRAGAVRALLADPSTAYVLVTSARPDAVAEASFFAEKLTERDIVTAALIVNRIHSHFGGTAGTPTEVPGALAPLAANMTALNEVAAREEGSYAALAEQLAPAAVGRIPLFGQDVHDLIGLQRTADVLFG